MSKENEEDIPLAPISELILNLRKRTKVFMVIMLFSLPSSILALLLSYLLIIANVPTLGFSSVTILFLIFLFFSAITSILTIIIVPDYLSDITREMERTSQSIAFSLTPPEGKTPQEKILRQLARTDYRIGRILNETPGFTQLNAKVKGESGKEYDFDVVVNKPAKFPRKLLGDSGGVVVFAVRFNEPSLVDTQTIKNFRASIQDCLKKLRLRVPTRVLVVSASGFDEATFEYVRSKDGGFNFFGAHCPIELIKENVNGTFDVISF